MSSVDASQVYMHPRKPSAVARYYCCETNNLPSVDAISQTDGFSNAFMLAFNDPASAGLAFERFQEDGTVPNHGHGPWVVFMGRRPGVFTS